MFKTILATALLCAALATSSVAMDMACDDASMMKLETDTNAMTDASKKEIAMKEMAMAKEAMTAKDMEKCKMHMDNAMQGKSSM